MEQTFYQFGIPYLRWTDENGNVWEAVKEQVEYFGKDFFEGIPEGLEDEQISSSNMDDREYIDALYNCVKGLNYPFPERK